jgi:hypothetical protein
LLRGGKPIASKTDEENAAEMLAWGEYMGKLNESGNLAGGLPLRPEGSVVSSTGIAAEPVTSSSEGVVGGYLLLNAESLEHACELVKNCPHVVNEGNIEVREVAAPPSME